MRLLFNKASQGPTELRKLTGSYYANNDFSKIETFILLETEILIELIGSEVYQLAEDFYYAAEPPADPASSYPDLLQHIQLPIALAAAYKFYQSTIVGHEDTGRKLKIDRENESIPFEWMLDRDDQAHERKTFTAIDRLIKFLDKSDLTQWKDSEVQKATRNLFVNTTKVFNSTFPIDNSGRFYYSVVPFITNIEKNIIGKALGAVKYKALLTWHQSIESDTAPEEPTETDIDNSMLLALIRECVPLLAMATAVKRFSLNVLPFCVVQNFKSMIQTSNASQAALAEVIRGYSESLEKEAESTLNELQKYINRDVAGALEYDLLPNNPQGQKYFRT